MNFLEQVGAFTGQSAAIINSNFAAIYGLTQGQGTAYFLDPSLGSDSYNATLATQRAERGRALLSVLQTGETGAPVPGANIYSRGEQSQLRC